MFNNLRAFNFDNADSYDEDFILSTANAYKLLDKLNELSANVGYVSEVHDCISEIRRQMPKRPSLPQLMSIDELRKLYPLPILPQSCGDWTSYMETTYLRLQESKMCHETLIICDCKTMFNTSYPKESLPACDSCPYCHKLHHDLH